MSDRSVPQLLERLTTGDPIGRVFAAEELGELGDAAAAPSLVAALRGLSYQTRADYSIATACIEALTSLGAVESWPAICDALQKTIGDDVVPEWACACLVRLQAKDCLPTLRGLLADERAADHRGDLRRAIEALAQS